ncbi:hypothetical protein [Fictibacillus sp. 7GRE50]|nr:hypothetical protein [Fictibacillus sp. 7GRE50]
MNHNKLLKNFGRQAKIREKEFQKRWRVENYWLDIFHVGWEKK